MSECVCVCVVCVCVVCGWVGGCHGGCVFVPVCLSVCLCVRVQVTQSQSAPQPLLSATARLWFLSACCAVAEGADVPLSHTVVPEPSSRCPPDVCVSVVLGDKLHRVSVLGGREGMPRSLGSVFGGSVTRYLGGCSRVEESRVVPIGHVTSLFGNLAVTPDGATLLVSDACSGNGPLRREDDYWRDRRAINAFAVADGSPRAGASLTGGGYYPFLVCQWNQPTWSQFAVSIAVDGYMFVADAGNHRVHVLTPRVRFDSFLGVGQLHCPSGVCANTVVVVVSESNPANCISVFNRGDGALLRRFGSEGSGDGQLHFPSGLCFLSGDRHVAVADSNNHRVTVFSTDGEFVRHVGVGELESPTDVAASAFGELIVADTGHDRVVVFSPCGVLLKSMGHGRFTGVAIHGSTVFALRRDGSHNGACVLFE